MTRRRPPTLQLSIAALVLTLVASACGGATGSAAPSPETVRVVTTTTILADLVAQVGGSRVTVDSLVPKGGEVHTFDPTPSDVRRLAAADLVFLNGLGLDDWLASLVTDAGTTAPVVRLGEDLVGVDYIAGGVDGREVNPHLWLNVAYAAKYAERIAGQLRILDPAHAADYEAGLAAYATVLDGLDRGYRIFVAADAVCSRDDDHRSLALEAMGRAGAAIVPTETLVFQMLERCGTPQFKELLPLIK